MDEGGVEELTRRLTSAPIEPVGQFAQASNATLLVRLLDRDSRPLEQVERELGRQPVLEDFDPDDLAVHKPARGEAPLWDFPSGTLHRREVAAYEVARAAGWDLVPVTVLREGPFGPGSLQQFVAHDPTLHYFRLLEVGAPGVIDQLRRMVVFDVLIDNADRKGGHVLLAAADWDGDTVDGAIRLIDHGVTFNVEHKLRTVAWEFAGEPLEEQLRAAVRQLVAQLDGPLRPRLEALLSVPEVEVLYGRVQKVLSLAALPAPHGPRAVPWPML